MWRLVYERIDAAHLRGRPEPAARAAVWAAETEPPAKAAAWLEIVLSAADLVTWTRLLGLAAHRRTRSRRDRHLPLWGLHVAARAIRGARAPTTDRLHLALGRDHRDRLPTIRTAFD